MKYLTKYDSHSCQYFQQLVSEKVLLWILISWRDIHNIYSWMMVVDSKDVNSLKDKIQAMTQDRDMTTSMYNSLYREQEDLKVEKTKYYDNCRYAITDIIWLEAQIKNLQTLEKDHELDEEKKEVDHLKNMIEEAYKRERILTKTTQGKWKFKLVE